MQPASDLSSKSLRELFSLRDRLERRVASLRSALVVEATLRTGGEHKRKPSSGEAASGIPREHSNEPHPSSDNNNTGTSSPTTASAPAGVGCSSTSDAKDRIFTAVLTEDAEYLHRLLSEGRCDPNCRDFKGRTPLHLACFTGDLACVELLVEFGAEVNALDDKQQTPREVAVFNNNQSIVAFLDPGKVGAESSAGSSSTSTSCSSDADVDDVVFGEGGPPPDRDADEAAEAAAAAVGGGDASPPPSSSDPDAAAGRTPPQRPAGTLSAKTLSAALPSPFTSPSLRPSALIAPAALVAAADAPAAPAALDQTQIPSPPKRDAKASASTSSLPNVFDNNNSFLVSQTSLVGAVSAAPAAKERSILDRRMQPSLFVTVGDTESIVVCMVGLPGRGKSFLSKNCARFLRWKGVPTQVFNAGDYRRRILGVEGTNSAAWFDSKDAKAKEQREQMAHLACEDAAKFLKANPVAVVFIDATNTNRVRRQWLIDFFSGRGEVGRDNVLLPSGRGLVAPHHILFIESVCDDDEMITQNILRDKVTNGDYNSSVPVAQVVSDFRARIDKYRQQYEPIDQVVDEPLSFLKVINLKQTIVANRLTGRLQTLTASLITHLYPVASSLYIVIPRGRQQDLHDEEKALLSTRLVSSPEEIDEMAPQLAAFLRERCAKLAETGQRFHLAYGGAADPSSERAVAGVLRAFAEQHATMFPSQPAATAAPSASSAAASPAVASPLPVSHVIPANLTITTLETLQPMKFGLVDGQTIAAARREYPRVMESVYVPRSAEPLLSRKEISGPAALESLTLSGKHQHQHASTSNNATPAGNVKLPANAAIPASPPAPPASNGKQECDPAAQVQTPPQPQHHHHHHHKLPSQQQLARTYFTAYPKGESLRQVAVRIWNLILEWKRCQGPLMYLCPEAHANLLLAFGMDLPPEAASQLRLPRCTIVEVTAKHALVLRSLLAPPTSTA